MSHLFRRLCSRTGPERAPLTSYAFVIDNRRCIGCHACTVACKAEHGDPIGINKTWVQYVEKGIFPDTRRSFTVTRCNHCADAPCVEICPVTSLYTRGDGIVDFDPRRCIGCKACIQACPYDALAIDPGLGTATKCNFCAHRVDVGREPACVTVCPEEAIIAGDLEDPRSLVSRLVAREPVTVRKPEKGTLPKLFYIEGDLAAVGPLVAARSATVALFGEAPRPGVSGPEPLPDGAAGVAAAAAGAGAGDGNGGRDDLYDDDGYPLGQGRTAARRTLAALFGDARKTYTIGQRHQGSWGTAVSFYVAFKGLAAGAFLAPALAIGFGLHDVSASAMVAAHGGALLALLFTSICLVADLKRRDRFLWVLLRPQWRSWLVRGAYALAAYGALLACSLALWLRAPGAARWLLWPGAALAALVACYTAFLFWQAKGRDLWQSPLSPIHLLLEALAFGSGLLMVLARDDAAAEAPFRTALLALLPLGVAVALLELLARHPTEDATRAARSILAGEHANVFWLGRVAAGTAVPMTILSLGPAPLGSPLAMLVLVLMFLGYALFDHVWVKAPQQVPLA